MGRLLSMFCFASRRRHTRCGRDWSSDVCSSDLEANIGAPQVAYREKITRAVTHDYVHKKQTGGHGQFARVKIVAEPTAPGMAFEFENEVVGGAVPKEFVPAVEKGLESVLGSGVLAGFPVVDIKVSLI